ncbi:MAG: DoxX family membrane protein [Patescibacteria group bacterium]
MPFSASPTLILRLSLAIVFMWFGVHKILEPQYWVDAWLPQWMIAFVERLSVGAPDFIRLQGVGETLLGIGLASGLLVRWCAAAGAALLAVVLMIYGFNEVTVRDIGLLGACLALALWPPRRPWAL